MGEEIQAQPTYINLFIQLLNEGRVKNTIATITLQCTYLFSLALLSYYVEGVESSELTNYLLTR